MGARETALNALIACRKNGAWSNGVLKEYVQRDRLDSRDAGLAAHLCYGVLQNRQKLDFYLKQLLTGKLKDLHPAARDILHLGLYQIYEMDKIPESAAVNESVGLAKKYCKKLRSAPGLVNAVLRSAVRGREELKAPRGWQEIYSHPQPLIDLLMKRNIPFRCPKRDFGLFSAKTTRDVVAFMEFLQDQKNVDAFRRICYKGGFYLDKKTVEIACKTVQMKGITFTQALREQAKAPRPPG